MTIQLINACFISGILQAAGSQHTLDEATEAGLIYQGMASRVGDAPNQGGDLSGPVMANAAGTALVVNGVPFMFYNSIDPRTYGAVCDGQIVIDANCVQISGNIYRVASATANGGAGFTSDDIGKTITVMPRGASDTVYSVKAGFITNIVNTNQAYVDLGGTPSGTLTGMRCVFGTDDTAAWNLAFAAAGTTKLPVFQPPHISCIKNLTKLPDQCVFFGSGPDQTRTWPHDHIMGQGGLVCTQWPGNTVPMLSAGFGNAFIGLTLDGNGLCDLATLSFAADDGKGSVTNCMILSGYGRTVRSWATCNFTNSSFFAHRACITENFWVSGDNRVVSCDISGSGDAKPIILIDASGVDIIGCHTWKDAEMLAVSPNKGTGVGIHFKPTTAGLSHTVNITDHTFDSCDGAHLHIDMSASNANHTDFSVSNCKAYQYGTLADGSYPVIDIDVPAGRVIRGLRVEGISGMGAYDAVDDGTSGKYTYLVDGAGVAGNIYGAVTGGSVVVNCAALYNFSATWTAWDHDHGNVILTSNAATTVVKSTTT